MAKYSLLLGAIGGFISVALGAFGAHGLKERLSEYHLGVFQTGVQYQFWHSIALLFVGLLYLQSPQERLSLVTTLFVVGILIFSGSLYALALTQIPRFGMITPLGGLAFLAAWAVLIWQFWNARSA